MNEKSLVNAEKLEKKNNDSKEYSAINKSNGDIDYSRCIIDLMGKIHNKKLLKRVYRLLEYLYLRKDDEGSVTEAETREPLATELLRDCLEEIQGNLESLDVFERELIEIQKKTFELQRLIHIEKININDFLGQE